MTQTAPPAPASRAGDVVAVGHEIGRIATDGTIIGRAEPFAKVFASSRQVKRAVGVMAWAILEDIALDAHLDHVGRLVATTNVRRIADNLGVSKNTVATHLTRLRDAGFVLREEGDHDDTGRYTVSCYVLDPSACVERFTHTPARHQRTVTDDPEITANATDEGTRSGQGVAADIDAHDSPTATNPTRPVADSRADDVETTDGLESLTEDVFGPCTSSWDTDAAAVSQSVGHRGLGHKNKEVVVLREQHRAREGPLPNAAEDRLVAAGVAPTRATALASRHPPDRIDDVLDAVSTRLVDNPAGWIVTALDHDWDIDDLAEHARQQRRRRDSATRQRAARRRAEWATSHQTRQQQAHNVGWANVAVGILDDEQLTCLVEHLATPTLPAATRSIRLITARVTGWVAAACHHLPDLDPEHAITQALIDPDDVAPLGPLPAPPTTPPPQSATLDQRIAAALHQTDRPHETDRDPPTTSDPPQPADHAA